MEMVKELTDYEYQIEEYHVEYEMLRQYQEAKRAKFEAKIKEFTDWLDTVTASDFGDDGISGVFAVC